MNLRDAFLHQSEACLNLGSPFMARLMRLADERLQPGNTLTDTMFNWPRDASSKSDAVPLRFAAGLHALFLTNRALVDVYPPEDVDDDTLWSAVETAISHHEAELLTWLETAPQTNEVRRSAVILAALAELHSVCDLPVELYELGASAGLNLRADHFCLETGSVTLGSRKSSVVLRPEWSGSEPPTQLPNIVRRAGVDLSPIDPSSGDGQLRLLAFLWADQGSRLEQTRAAIDIAKRVPARVDAGDAADWLEAQLASNNSEHLKVVYHTVAEQYFPEETKARVNAALANANGPIARVSMEYDGGRGAAVSISLSHSSFALTGRADFHGRWIEWNWT